MSVQDQIRKGVQQAQQAPGPTEIEAQANEDKVRVSVRSSGPIGVSVDSIEVQRERLDADGARQACEDLEGRVHYLLEPLRVVECDAEAGVTQVRSDKPSTDQSGRHYYELTGQAGRLDIKRFAKPDDGPRQREPLDLTHQQLERLAGDLLDAGESRKT